MTEEISELKPKDLTSYERTELISVRSIALEKGRDVPQIEIGDESNMVKIAMMELELGAIPYLIKREFPDGTVKLYKIIPNYM